MAKRSIVCSYTKEGRSAIHTELNLNPVSYTHLDVYKRQVYLCLDSDQAGNDACSRLVELMPEGLTVHRLIPPVSYTHLKKYRQGEEYGSARWSA